MEERSAPDRFLLCSSLLVWDELDPRIMLLKVPILTIALAGVGIP